MTPLVDHGAAVAAASASSQAGQALAAKDPALVAQLSQYATAAQIPPSVLGQAVAEFGLPGLQTLSQEAPQLEVLQQYGPAVSNPKDWQKWWWVAIGAQVLFLPFIFVMTGRWSPKKAREDAEAHAKRVEEELAALTAA